MPDALGSAVTPVPLEAVPDAMIVVDGSGVILMANNQACELFGWERTELIGLRVERLVPPRFTAAHQQGLRHFFGISKAREMGESVELFGLRRDGSEFPLEIALNPFQVGGDSLVAASIRNLTNTLRFKAATRRAHYYASLVKLGDQALRTKGVDEVLSGLPTHVAAALHADAVVLYWASGEMKWHPRATYGVPLPLMENLVIPAIDGNEVDSASPAREAQIIGDYRDQPAPASPLIAALGLKSGLSVPLVSQGRAMGLIVAHSQQLNLFAEEELYFLQAVGNVIVEAAIRGEVEILLAHSQRLETIGQLAGGIAHDFNNILTIVLGNLQMLREAIVDTGSSGLLPLVESAQRASRRGADLTHKLLTFSRRQALAPSAIDPRVTLAALADMLQGTMGESIQIDWWVAPDCPPCIADPAELDNAIVNLALNARDAMPNGGSIRMAADSLMVNAKTPDIGGELAPGRYTMFSVNDTGQGMPPQVLRHMYEPFFTTKLGGKGSGLGLSMVHGFVKQSRGAVRIDSQPGKGTVARLYFPVAERRSAAAEPRRGQRESGRRGLERETILIVEDDLGVMEIAEGFLSKAGYRILKASTAEQALRWLKGTESISLLFTDVVLGEGELGSVLAEQALEIRPQLQVLYTSGFASGALNLAELRPEQFLPKPYQREVLVERVHQLLAEAD